MENYFHINVNDSIVFTFENGLFYSTKKLKRNKPYRVIETYIDKTKKRYMELTATPGPDPIRQIKVKNQIGKEIWISMTDRDKIKELKIHRRQVLCDILDIENNF